MLHWVYSKVQYFSEYLSKWDDTLHKDIEEKELVERYIKSLETPFGFLEAIQTEIRDTEGNDIMDGSGGAGQQPQSQLEVIVKENEKKIRVQEQ